MIKNTIGYNIISKLNFENENFGILQTDNIIDNNRNVGLVWKVINKSNGEIENTNGVKLLNFKTSNFSLYTTISDVDIKNNNIQFESDIILTDGKNNNIFFNTSSTFTGAGLRFNIKNVFNNGLEIIYGTYKISFNYKFERDVLYNIVVSKNETIYSLYVNGLIVGHCVSKDFTNLININSNPVVSIGSKTGYGSTAIDEFVGKMGNINISTDVVNKYDKSFTKYGNNLISRLNFGNLSTTPSTLLYTCDLEAVIDTNIKWTYGDINVNNEYGMFNNISSFETQLPNINTIYFNIHNSINNKDIELVNMNDTYKVIYNSNNGDSNSNNVVVNDYTTSALDFENDIVDQIETTIWEKSGTADITVNNKLFGSKSFETKELGDSLYTNSSVITGGVTPFTIEFYALINGRSGWSDTSNIQYPLISKYLGTTSDTKQQLHIQGGQGNKLNFERQISSGSVLNMGGIHNIKFNEINKYTLSYDGSALRVFINDKLDMVGGSNIGLGFSGSEKFNFLNSFASHESSFKMTTKGIIDNINIHDGIATKVRDPDPYEEYLISDISFVGENNSKTIVDSVNIEDEYLNNVSAILEYDSYNNKLVDLSNNKNVFIHHGSIIKGDLYNGKRSIVLGTNSYIRLQDTYLFDSGDFTVEAYVKVNNQNYNPIISINNSINTSRLTWVIRNNPMINTMWDGSWMNENSMNVDHNLYNKWCHIAMTRSGNQYYFYIDGILTGTHTRTPSVNLGMQDDLFIGRTLTNTEIGNFQLNQLRITKGIARYTENNFIVPKYFNKYKNNWLSHGSATISTDKTFNEFSSLYLDGNDSYISTIGTDSYTLNREDFTISFNYSLSSLDSHMVIVDYKQEDEVNGTGWQLYIDGFSGSIVIYDRGNEISNTVLQSTLSYSEIDREYKVDIIRKNDTFYIYVDGKLDSQVNKEINFNTIQRYFSIGGQVNDRDSSQDFHGYIKNFKFYKGVAVIPEDPTGKIQLDFDNNFNDKYGNSTWTNNGVTFDQVNSVKGHAAYFGSDNQRIYCGQNDNLNFENKNFMMSVDIKPTMYRDYAVIIGSTHSTNTSAHFSWFGNGTENYSIGFGDAGMGAVGGNVYINNYYYIKIERNNSASHIFINDVLVASTSISHDQQINYNGNNGTQIGHGWNNSNPVNKYVGYIDNFKAIKNYQEGTIIDRPAVHLPLETNAINTGFTPLTINSVGSPTYTTVDGKKCIKFGSGKYLTINSNKILNLGASSDFYIEFDFYPIKNRNGILSNKSGWVAGTSYILHDTTIGFNYWDGSNNVGLGSTNALTLNAWNNVIVHRKDGVLSIVVNDSTPNTMTFEYPLNFNLGNNGTTIGTYGTDSGSTQNVNTGYMSNFKIFVGTSQPPETYNDKKVLDLDFKPTGKSYLFKDNNNKCVIHPVNITQRDYQDSQYCCTFNGTNQYLQLGKNNLFNFGLDDFIINLKLKINSLSKNFNQILSAGGSTVGRPYIGILGQTHETYPNKLVLSISGGTIVFVSNNNFDVNVIYDIKFVKNDNTLSLYINDTLDSSITAWQSDPNNLIKNLNLNFNLNSETVIGRVMSNENEYFDGVIYAIKVFRNTADLSLLDDDENTIAEDSFLLTNGIESHELFFNNSNSKHDIKVVSDDTKIKLRVNNEEVEVPKTIDVSNVKLLNEYKSRFKDIKVYDVAINDDDEFLGSELIDSEYPEMVIIDDSDSIDITNVGDYIIDGFIEGSYNSKYSIYNKNEETEVICGYGDYYYDGIDYKYIDDYEIYEHETGLRYPLYKHVMERGSISGVVNISKCSVGNSKINPIDMTAWCYTSETQRLVGKYNINIDGTYIIPNLDIHTRYDIIFKHNNRLIENISSSYRKPKRIDNIKNPKIINMNYEYNPRSTFIKYTWKYLENVSFTNIKLYITDNTIIDSSTSYIELEQNIEFYNDYNFIKNHQYYVTIVAEYEGNEYRSQMIVNTHNRTPIVISNAEFNNINGNVLLTW